MVSEEKLEQICARLAFLEAKMEEGSAMYAIDHLAKEYSDIKPIDQQI